ncbi:two-component system, OmpR family, sensor histidine kinase KdpD [Actinokineospora alba]|uniref:histidine kinase n=1 Tax=Actinokineospora alba TaxID=504798 RepID=A0A1H0NAG2_9PSEU|nr:DUF4118 domain-containing protein [Actinokineospora alba]TDP68645.1 two-component system sensor histidine kinase KdpD [Actinokineospora alba]SDH83508.1 two-component system, OmpR family, sensor histidine kinase KdpD [Actinokineospora alba]SDO89653.1 two-component system, OmpR family, sensor histidine kinase KdpD [Actinokineospora alba]
MSETEGHRPRRGELRIYLGAAPGVGKTFAMLDEGRRRRERGTDVVVGLVETHGRAKTAALLDGLEVIPRRRSEHRGVELTELDVDAVLAREPRLALVDELAHTNVPGSRNAKRWQDIEELLDAGIDVLSTVNIQHLEGLNDVVERITGVRQQETVPDEVVRRAEQVELVDLTPEALRRRLAHGNVYPEHRVDAALGSYFRPGNLIALRELALLWVADQVDVALRRHRADESITDTWETRERVVVAVTGGPESETMVRRARRIASRAGADFLVVHVLRGDGLTGADPHALARLRTLADDVGATFHTVVGDDVPTALLDFARGVDATQLVLGTSRRSRLARLLDAGIGSAVLQGSGAIDVHMVTHKESGVRRANPAARGALTRRHRLLGLTAAILGPALVTALGLPLRATLDISSLVVAHMLVLVGVAMLGGIGPALVAALLSGALLNYFFTEPYHTLLVADGSNVVTLAGMVAVGVLVALVVDRASRRAAEAARAGTEAALLGSYARTVLTHKEPLPRLLAKIRENFGQDSVALLEKRDGEWREAAVAGTPSGEPGTEVPVTDDIVLALRGKPLPAADRRVLETAAGQALLALRQQRMAEEAAHGRAMADTAKLRTALLSAVGHDLRTPLTSIKAAIGSLRDTSIELSPHDTGELLATVEESADRLAGLVDNLLDASRLATGAVRPHLDEVGYDEVANRALSGMDGRDAVAVDIDERLPAVLADAGLLERVIANVVDNALRHGGSGVAVRASSHAAQVELRVVDRGPGLPKGAADTAFEPFQRLGDRDPTTGVGLGLAVAKGFTEAMGGTISAEDTPGGGLTIVIALRAAGNGEK